MYTLGHKCATRKFILFRIDDDIPIETLEINESSEVVEFESKTKETYFQISPQAVSG